MINKIILLGDFKTLYSMPLKSSSVTRIAYGLRKNGFDVKQIHHCTNFSKEELEQIILNFSSGEEVLVCVSTSFLAGIDRKNKNLFRESQKFKEKGLYTWGSKSYNFLITIGELCKKYNFKYILGGWEINKEKISYKEDLYSFNVLKEYVTYFIEGNNFYILEKICRGESINIEVINDRSMIISNDNIDFSDCASTLLPEDNVILGESVCTEIAAGCIFSCSFCDYAALGKKKNEYTRTYESFEREVKENYNNFKTTLYTLTDNIVNDTPEKIRYLIDVREKNGIDLKWVGYARLDTIQTIEQAKLLKASGMIGANFGIESFYKPTGKYIGKITDKDRLMKSLEILRTVFEDELIISGLFIAGLPEETIDHMNKTFEWLNSTEGRYFIDHYAYTAFILYPKNKNKNDINVARNDPFKDYKFSPRNPRNWLSPWSFFDEVQKLARKFTEYKKNPIGGAFNLPFFVNCGVPLNDIMYTIRNSGKKNITPPINMDINKFINQYKEACLAQRK